MGSSTEPDRSLSSGISIPQWMKSRIGDRYDIEETFSPPSHDDAFFYIRYPKSTNTLSTSTVTEVKTVTPPQSQDFSQHTLPCRQFIPSASMSSEGNTNSFIKPAVPRIKPQGPDDDIVGEGGACGKSVVEVAKQMISTKSFLRSFNVSGSNENLSVPDSGFDPTRRRGSRSLPASPLGSPTQSPASSPRTQRRAHPNKFFTGTYTIPEKREIAGEEARPGYLGGWIWSGLLGNRDVVAGISPATPVEEEEQVDDTIKSLDSVDGRRRKKSKELPKAPIFTLNGQKSDTGRLTPGEKVILQPKPSELREMNFWSPTSM